MRHLIQISGFIPSKDSSRRDIRRSILPRILAYSVSFLLLVGCGVTATATVEANTPAPVTNTPTSTTPPTAASTPTESPIVFGTADFSSTKFWQGGDSCGPKTLTVRVQVSPPEAVFSLGLFYRIVEQDGPGSHPWSEGFAMHPMGNGRYTLTLHSNDLPDIFIWLNETWLEVQFVANDEDGQAIDRSEVIRSVTLAKCYV